MQVQGLMFKKNAKKMLTLKLEEQICEPHIFPCCTAHGQILMSKENKYYML